jgi:hypothetical protein
MEPGECKLTSRALMPIDYEKWSSKAQGLLDRVRFYLQAEDEVQRIDYLLEVCLLQNNRDSILTKAA